jgi:transcriptional regulator with XRE-family HTH domain
MSTILDDDAEAVFTRRLGARLKAEREARSWSIAALAERSGVSRAMISRIERGEVSPTAALLTRLSGAFELSLSRLLARAELGGGRLLRAADQSAWRDPGTGYVRRPLTPPGAELELVRVDLPAGATVPAPAASHAFRRGHAIWVLAGRLHFTEGEETHQLGPGDCLSLGPPADCAYVNPSATQPCTYVVAIVWR